MAAGYFGAILGGWVLFQLRKIGDASWLIKCCFVALMFHVAAHPCDASTDQRRLYFYYPKHTKRKHRRLAYLSGRNPPKRSGLIRKWISDASDIKRPWKPIYEMCLVWAKASLINITFLKRLWWFHVRDFVDWTYLEKVSHSQILEKGLAAHIIIRLGGRNTPLVLNQSAIAMGGARSRMQWQCPCKIQ